MHTKKLLVGGLVLSAVLGGTFYFAQGDSLQGKFSGVKTVTTTGVGSTSSGTALKPDFYFGASGVAYHESNNYFQAEVCGTNISSTTIAKQTKLQFAVSGGETNTVEFTPKSGCQTVYSGDLNSSFDILESGTYDLIVTVDSSSLHTESNETNNAASASVAIEPNYYLFDADAMPDLSIEGVELDWTHGLLEVNVCADNALSGVSASSVKVSYTASQNGTELEDEERTLPSLSTLDNSCKVVTLDVSGTWSGAVSEGTFDIEMSIDSQDRIPETNEGNNSYNGAVAVDMSW